MCVAGNWSPQSQNGYYPHTHMLISLSDCVYSHDRGLVCTMIGWVISNALSYFRKIRAAAAAGHDTFYVYKLCPHDPPGTVLMCTY